MYLSRCFQLKRLELPAALINDVGLNYILHLTNLTHLRLNSTQVTDNGAVLLTSLQKLEKLDLAFSQVLTYLQNLFCF